MALRFLPDPGVLGQLGEARAARLLEERTRLLARRGEGPSAPPAAPVLVVALGEELLGLPLARVAAVLPAEAASPLPGSPAEVLGLRARAGRIHAVLDLAWMLGLEGGAGEHDVLLRPLPIAGISPTAGRRLALRVGRALSAVAPQPLPPELGPQDAAGVIAFRATIPGTEAEDAHRMVGVLDLDRLLLPYAAPLPGA
ncbi:chemotaxis protein CheW [Roseomonas sp. KE2513]|uniref:chemotaxis protein CheW n=1 Tax=Roseomonas sp. KE2513 TaxID=2479202 RepID=UPI0018DFE052|nr:chemotaxis protein CheW [Roseomonas sp. KE2513]MBI0535830.1 chemotaxis protein CheW [Roseomonas sp. KE2513]